MSTIHLDGRDPQEVVDAAPEYATIQADPTRQIDVETPLVVETPGLTLRGFTLRLADGANANVVALRADGVSLVDFRVDGNRHGQRGDHTLSGVVVSDADAVTVRSGYVRDVDRHGVLVGPGSLSYDSPDKQRVLRETHTTDVTVRDVRVDTPGRDGCSVQGIGTSNVTVENVRAVESAQRGAVEVKDGASNVTVTNCCAEASAYAVAIQDHGDFGTRDVLVANNLADSCTKLVDAQTSVRHERIVVVNNVGRDVSGDPDLSVEGGIHVSRIDGLVVTGNAIDAVGATGIDVRDCSNVQVVGNAVNDVDGSGLSLVDCPGSLVTGNLLANVAEDGVVCRATRGTVLSEVQICNNTCRDYGERGIRLVEDEGTIDYYLVANNVLHGERAGIVDGASGSHRVISDNVT